MPYPDEPDDDPGFVPPLPPEDRLWRHPSEMAAMRASAPSPTGPSASAAGTAATEPKPGGSGQGRLVVASAVAGVVLTLVVLGAIGALGRDDPKVVVEQVAVDLPSDQRAAVETLGPAIARLDARHGSTTVVATAVVYRSDGHLLTTTDAVDGATSLAVSLADGRVLPASLVGSDGVSGVAVVKVDATDLPAAVLGDPDAVKAGEPAMALAHAPDPAASPAVAAGHVTGTGWRLDSGVGTWHDLIRTTLDTDPSGSGAVLCTEGGAVLGLIMPADPSAEAEPDEPATTTRVVDGTTLAAAPTGTPRYATPIDLAVRAADDLVATGRAHYAWLGVQGDDVEPERAAGLGRAGAAIDSVTPGSPADRAGLRTGDVVTAVDTRPVGSMSALVVALRDRRPNESVPLTVVRDATPRVVPVTLTEQP